MRVATDHVGLSVTDLDAATEFYAGAFAFTCEFAFDLPQQIRGAMLINESGARLELLQRPRATAGIQGAQPLDALATLGYGHVALSAPDIEPVFRRALASGASGVVEPSPSPEPGVRFAFLADPEGNLIELVERR